jgi:beta-galactosidase
MCGEFWSGWFDHWHADGRDQRAPEEIMKEVNTFFDLGASFNFYMFHGGTNFSFWNGANGSPTSYEPTVTSYDYTAPLTEAGDTTPMYDALRETIERRTGKKAPDIAIRNSQKAAYGKLTLTEAAPLFDNLSALATPVRAAFPKTMEELDQDFGYVLYRTTLTGPFEELPVECGKIHDRAIFYLNGKQIGIYERGRGGDTPRLSLGFGETAQLDILVENMGRINYGTELLDRKGILNGVRLGQRFHYGWEMFPMTMDDVSALAYTAEAETSACPAFLRGKLTIEGKPCDSFLKLDGFTKGFVVVNGFNIGRYYPVAGPQQTLYVPAPLLREGENEIVVFESDGYKAPVIEFVDKPVLHL